MQAQSTNTVLMIEPVAFGANPETAESNIFQKDGISGNVQELALIEFEALVTKLDTKGVQVIRIQDTVAPRTTDSIFPNNWISTHADGTVVLYPMEAESRRLERREDILGLLESDYRFCYDRVLDFTPYEQSAQYLEGTGSLILDRVNKIAYACYSSRTDKELLILWAASLGYSVCGFSAAVDSGEQIYHTNVMMCLGSKIAVICLDVIKDADEKLKVIQSLEKTKHEILEISEKQMFQFAGNMLELTGKGDKNLLLMSAAANAALSEEQINIIENHVEIVSSPIPTIEFCGGGSVRCMLAEIFLLQAKGSE